jgi:hypothetical protein
MEDVEGTRHDFHTAGHTGGVQSHGRMAITVEAGWLVK